MTTNNTEKRCSKCEVVTPLKDYYKREASLDGLQTVCKECQKAASIEVYQDDPERRKAMSTAWGKANLEAKRSHGRKWYNDNAEANLARRRELCAAEKAKVEAGDEEAIKRRDTKRAYARKWYNENTVKGTEENG